MMSMGWGFFPWPIVAVAVMIAFAVLMAARLARGHGAMGCGFSPSAPTRRRWEVETPTPPAPQDPMSTLRRRLVDGEIGLPEFEARLDALLRSDASLSMPWSDQPGDEPKATR